MMSQKEIIGDLTFVTLSDTGSSHLKNGTCNQDAVKYSCKDSDFLLAISDGVGSCPKAEKGAQAVMTAAERVFQSVLNQSLMFSADAVIIAFISEWRAVIDDVRLDDYGATVKMAIRIGASLRLFSLGDGVIAVTSSGINMISPEENSSFANMTRCLGNGISPSDFWMGEITLDTYVPFVVFACTDGVSNWIVNGKEMELVQEIESRTPSDELECQLKEFLADIAEYSSDDKTLGVVKYEQKNGKPKW